MASSRAAIAATVAVAAAALTVQGVLSAGPVHRTVAAKLPLAAGTKAHVVQVTGEDFRFDAPDEVA